MAGSEEEASLRTACLLPFQRREGALGERGRSICFGLQALRCLVTSSEVMVMRVERNGRERLGWKK